MINESMLQWMQSHYTRATQKQRSNRKTVLLTFDQYVGLWTPYYLKSLRLNLQNQINMNKFQQTDRGICLTWDSYKSSQGEIMDHTNTRIASRYLSKRICRIMSGDKHTEQAKAKIAKARTGTHHSEETRAIMSAAQSGVEKSQAHKEAMREAAKRRWARVRGEIE